MTGSLKGKRALVTGGAAGIGKEIALAYLEAGARVHICDLSQENMDQFASQHRGLSTTKADISSRTDLDNVYDDVRKHLGGLDVLVNNAGMSGPNAPIEDVNPEDWERVFAVNMHGTFFCTQRAIPLMKAEGAGAIINISSVSGRVPYAHRSPYSTSKFALVGFTQCLALELGDFGITANAILPGLVKGDRWFGNAQRRAARDGVTLDEVVAKSLARTATGRLVEADELAQTAVFLASSGARSISGQSISVCGYLQALSEPIRREA
jgi:NAD(P)-dependent dehydrogenase (short-subunit alcohol dehydrogenase family)